METLSQIVAKIDAKILFDYAIKESVKQEEQ